MPIGHKHPFFERNVYLVLLPIFESSYLVFFFLILSCMSCLCWLLIPYWSYYLNIFYPVLYIVILFIDSFTVQKLLSLIKFYLLFYFFCLRRQIQKVML